MATPSAVGDTMVATSLRATNLYGTVTAFTTSTLLVNPVDKYGRVNLTLRHESRSLWMWMNEHADQTYTFDLSAPVPPIDQQRGVLPWMRATAYRVHVDTNQHDPATDSYLITGCAERDRKTGDVFRFRHDTTGLSSEDPPSSWRTR